VCVCLNVCLSVQAFIKRLLQVSQLFSPPLICASFILLSELVKMRPSLLRLSKLPQVSDGCILLSGFCINVSLYCFCWCKINIIWRLVLRKVWWLGLVVSQHIVFNFWRYSTPNTGPGYYLGGWRAMDGHTVSVWNQPDRSTQPGHPSVSRHNEYQWKLAGTQTDMLHDAHGPAVSAGAWRWLRRRRSAPPFVPFGFWRT